jgi:hypothetical protein
MVVGAVGLPVCTVVEPLPPTVVADPPGAAAVVGEVLVEDEPQADSVTTAPTATANGMARCTGDLQGRGGCSGDWAYPCLTPLPRPISSSGCPEREV